MKHASKSLNAMGRIAKMMETKLGDDSGRRFVKHGHVRMRTTIAKRFRRAPQRGATILSRIPTHESVRQEIRDS